MLFLNIKEEIFFLKLLQFLFPFIFYTSSITLAQTHFPADPYFILEYEKAQFEGKLPMQSNLFRPLFYNTDTTSFSLTLRSEGYYNNNAPNQENMDVRYFSKGFGNFNSINLAFNSPYFSFMVEPYLKLDNFSRVNEVSRQAHFSVLNDYELGTNTSNYGTLRNLLAFVHFKGIGIGWHQGNRWWGPGVHTALQMTNNTIPIPAQIIGTLQEIKMGSFGFYALYTFANMNEQKGAFAKYLTSLNSKISWYGPLIITLGFSRNYLSGGELNNGYKWSENDARNIIFEGIFISNLVTDEYSTGGHDSWDQTLSGYASIIMPKRDLKIYAEVGFNDNRMYYADFLSQPDHSMATVFGVRDYGIGANKNYLWGFEWTNLMITYSSRHRTGGTGTWYTKQLYDYSSYQGRRWGAHSGSDSDDWYFYAGYISDKLLIIPAFNYERHGIVTHRPAEVKIEYTINTRYKFKDAWFGIFFEKQYEHFLGFPDYFYVNSKNIPSGYYKNEKLANSRTTSTLIFSFSKTINL